MARSREGREAANRTGLSQFLCNLFLFRETVRRTLFASRRACTSRRRDPKTVRSFPPFFFDNANFSEAEEGASGHEPRGSRHHVDGHVDQSHADALRRPLLRSCSTRSQVSAFPSASIRSEVACFFSLLLRSLGRPNISLTSTSCRFIPERLLFLGPDLAAAHFLVHRGASVKFLGDDAWYKKDKRVSFVFSI